ncbi:hypothetical protein CLS_30150 [[Clostridium] cf. saccharolyticum K10]|nr:hypothetical protein CLS_30150 [[Clostridium] cf. saccharolyticum K10]
MIQPSLWSRAEQSLSKTGNSYSRSHRTDDFCFFSVCRRR